MIEQLSFACDLRYRIYIISWPGYHESAIAIADAIMSSAVNSASVITIVYSDHESAVASIESSQYASIRRPQELFFSDKFQACLTDAGEDALLVIHADTECDSWPLLTQQYEKLLTGSLPWGV